MGDGLEVSRGRGGGEVGDGCCRGRIIRVTGIGQRNKANVSTQGLHPLVTFLVALRKQGEAEEHGAILRFLKTTACCRCRCGAIQAEQRGRLCGPETTGHESAGCVASAGKT